MEDIQVDGHERVVRFEDAATGLRGFLALHSTALGPGLGGTRFFPYADEGAALADVLRLSRAMSYKNAAAGLDAGGGKAVIVGDPTRDKTPELLRAYGRAVAALEGRYVTACDVGTYVADMDVIAETNPWTTGRSRELGGAGDSGELTALGVFVALKAAAEHVWPDGVAGRTVAVQGLGKVGRRLAGHLLDAGAHVVAADTSAVAIEQTLALHPGVRVVGPAELVELDADVFSPNAMNGTVAADTRARLVCGGANNQLADPSVAAALHERGVLWCPDYLVNAGGVIAVADEGLTPPYDDERARAKVLGIASTLATILRTAEAEGVPPAVASDRLAESRIRGASGP